MTERRVIRKNNSMEQQVLPLLPKSSSMPLSSSSSSSESEGEEEPPRTWSTPAGDNRNRKRMLSKQLSMRETTREAKWEKRRRQIMQSRLTMIVEGSGSGSGRDDGRTVVKEAEEANVGSSTTKGSGRLRSLTDEDLDELMGSIELGFGFHEEHGGHDLRRTLPALDLYFAVNRQLSDPKLRFSSPSPVSTPSATSSASTICDCGTPSPRSPNHHHSSPTDYLNIVSPGDSPQHVKTRLRHWAQAVACSVRQFC